jgi:hypothetical protein
MRAEKDPLIQRRRQLAAPLWLRGRSGPEVMQAINAWLESEAQDGVSLSTVYRDRRAIEQQWEQDYLAGTGPQRARNVAVLHRARREIFDALDEAETVAEKLACLDRLRANVESTGRFDGSLAPIAHEHGSDPNRPVVVEHRYDYSAFSLDELQSIRDRALAQNGAA